MSTKPRTKEEPVKDQIKSILEARRVWYCMPPANGYGRAGIFDFIACVRGGFLGIEAKRDDKEMPTRLQTENAVKAAGSNGVILLIHKGNIDLVETTINEMRQRMSDVPLSYRLNQWPEGEILALLDTGDKDVKVIKGKKK